MTVDRKSRRDLRRAVDSPNEASLKGMPMKNILMRLWREEEGQDLLEYALLIVLIVLVAAAAINPLGASIAKVFTNANACLSSTGSACT